MWWGQINKQYEIRIKDKNGNDLLNPNVQGCYNHSEIKLFNDINLEHEIKDSLISFYENNYYLALFGGGDKIILKNDKELHVGTFYLQLSKNTVDTIYCESLFQGNSLYLSKVVYNSSEVFSISDSRVITIVKD